MKITEKKTNLFSIDKKYSFVHCISLDCAMGAGIALTFRETFPRMKNILLHTVAENNIQYPFTILYEGGSNKIFNLITKEKYWYKPTYYTISSCIKQLRDMCSKHNIKYLAMPKIGCGLDKLQWNKVRKILEDTFKDTDIEILICYL